MRNLVVTGLAIVAAFTLASCNTVKGVGEDIEAGGRVISKTAEDVKDDISGKK